MKKEIKDIKTPSTVVSFCSGSFSAPEKNKFFSKQLQITKELILVIPRQKKLKCKLKYKRPVKQS